MSENGKEAGYWDDALQAVQSIEQRLEHGAADLRQLIEHGEKLSDLEQQHLQHEIEALDSLRTLEMDPDTLARCKLKWSREAAEARARAAALAELLDNLVRDHPVQIAGTAAAASAPGATSFGALAAALIDAKYPPTAANGDEGEGYVRVSEFPSWQVDFMLEAGVIERSPADASAVRLVEALDEDL
mmetsp:Transcript_50762/g.133519  ORF Transcript_50762/g.133519 Transcript_50762/m.133519 type:complete len:187 (+) Transcript_50762:73-633(+)